MKPKSLILILSLAAVVLISGCAQAGNGGGSNGRCATGNIEVIDADGSSSPEAGLTKVDTKRCFVRFKSADNIFVVVDGEKIVSIYKDFDGDKIYSEANDKNILNAQEGDQGTNAADLESVFYNDIDKLGKYLNALPAGIAADFTIGAPDIGLLSKMPAFCGDGKLNQPTEECDPPGGECPNSRICEAGKCKCAAAGSGVQAAKPASTASDEKTEESPAQTVRLSLINKMASDIILSKPKIEFNSDSDNPAACSSALSITVPSGSSKTIALTLKSKGEVSSFTNVIKTQEIKKAEDELRIGAASVTAGGSTDLTISEIKVESPADKKSTACKPDAEFKVDKKETGLVDLLLKVTAKTAVPSASPSPTTSPTGSPKTSASPALREPLASPTGSPSASATPKSSASASATASPTASTAASTSKTPTPTATPTPTPTPTTTSSVHTCTDGAEIKNSDLPCNCGSNSVSSISGTTYCCSGIPKSSPCSGGTVSCTNNAQATTQCTCGGATMPAGFYCCSGAPSFSSCSPSP